MKKKVIRISIVVVVIIFAFLMLGALDYLVNVDRKEDPTKRNVKAMKKDDYNQYGLEGNIELTSQSFYEDEDYIYYIDRLLKKFQYEDRNLEKAATIMNNLQTIIPENVNQYIIPMPERIMWEDGYPEQKNTYAEFMEKMEAIVPDEIELLDVREILNEHKDEYLFFRTDIGWTARGAYYGSRILCESMGIEPFALESYTEHMYNTHRGYHKQMAMYRYVQNQELYTRLEAIPNEPLFFYLLPGSKNRAIRATLEDDIEVIDTIKTVSKSRPGQTAFIGDYFQWALVDGDAKSEEKKTETAVLLCDLNGQLLAPFLSSYYKQVYVINLTHNRFSVEEFKQVFQEYDVSDVIIVQKAEAIGKTSENKILNRVYEMTE